MALPPLPTVSSSSDTFSVVNLSDDVIASVSPQKTTKDVTGERVLPLASSVSSPVTTSPRMKTTVLTANLDRGVADDKLRGVDSRCSLGIKIGDYNIKRDEGDEEQCDDDDADEDGDYDDLLHAYEKMIPGNFKVATGRLRKREPRGYTKRGCFCCKYGLGIRFTC